MFTGLVEHVGRVTAVAERDGGRRLRLDLGPLAAEGCGIGASVAVDGICLTVAARDGGHADFDLGGETLARSTAGSWSAGRAVNLERALALGQRLGGHLVSGHVDGVGNVIERRPEGSGLYLRVGLPGDGSVLVVRKGSIAIDGISLTVCDPDERGFGVALIPETVRATTIGTLRPGDRVNLEQDQIGRWIEALLRRSGAS